MRLSTSEMVVNSKIHIQSVHFFHSSLRFTHLPHCLEFFCLTEFINNQRLTVWELCHSSDTYCGDLVPEETFGELSEDCVTLRPVIWQNDPSMVSICFMKSKSKLVNEKSKIVPDGIFLFSISNFAKDVKGWNFVLYSVMVFWYIFEGVRFFLPATSLCLDNIWTYEVRYFVLIFWFFVNG